MKSPAMRCIIVSHTHWDREWYRTFQAFRARLVDTVDRVLDLIAEDAGFHFLLDGQSIIVEDYLEIRPERRSEIEAACRAGRMAIGPWYVQPDSLLPAGETHVRNLLEGRRVAGLFGGGSSIAYTPDSFGHPAQFPQLLAGFGLGPFVYWRGNGNEIEKLPSEYTWVGPDGSTLVACHLGAGYFGAWGLGEDVDAVVARLKTLGEGLAKRTESDRILLMNGIDHMLPDANTREIAEALAKETGWDVARGLLEAFAQDLPRTLPRFEGELLGGRVANLLPGVWSARTELKLRNRRCETLLTGWAEPWAALGRALGAPDESPALRVAWRSLLPNQAHDSICGCSQDRVHEQMVYRFDAASELASETVQRTLERIAGLGVERQLIGGEPIRIAVFNPSPHPRTDVVRLALEGYPAFTSRGIAPLLVANADAATRGFFLDGQPARVVPHEENVRPRLAPDTPVNDLEFVVRDVPGFGWRQLTLTRGEPAPDDVDDGREISAGSVRVRAEDGGTLCVEFGDARFEGLCALEDSGDRGDTYDFDPVGSGACSVVETQIRRRLHTSGIQYLEVRRTLQMPVGLSSDRQARSRETVEVPVVVEARVAPGVERVDLRVTVDNTACDHRLRMLFPTGSAPREFLAATTFDVARRTPGARDGTGWIHPAPSTFPQQGWVSVGGLCVVAPGLVEAEVRADGSVAITLLRSVGWLSRPDLTSRPGEAGPALPTPGAQCPGPLTAHLSLLRGADPAAACDAELGLRAVGSGGEPLIAAGESLLEIEPREILLSTLKPAEDGRGSILRLQNPTDSDLAARVRLGFEVADVLPVRLDETPVDQPVHRRGADIELSMPAHGLRSLRLLSRTDNS